MSDFQSWGRYPRATHTVVPIHWRTQNPFAGGSRGPYLAYGLGRSYGDACLNDGGTLLVARPLDRFIELDDQGGVIACEAGASLEQILALTVPRGWFLPVVPGTQHVTAAGAIANDVHGKNHHRAGTFGRHVVEIELLRSSGERIVCSPERDPDLFAATVGGLGLTGLVLSARIRLRPIASPFILADSVPIRDLDEFFDVSARSDEQYEYTVAWIDCLARGRGIGRGILHRGNHAEGPGGNPPRRKLRLGIPFELPFSPLNRVTLAGFNWAYYLRHRLSSPRRLVHYTSFFFPLDAVENWNRIYGRRGLLQFQCALPSENGLSGTREILDRVGRAGQGSFLSVLKNFGSAISPGMLSFPRQGSTIALDFPNRGEVTARLFRELHAIVRANGGAIYPAKDAHMTPGQFAAQYPRLERFRALLDPSFSSSLWRRVTHV